jgi:hypothetical protein
LKSSDDATCNPNDIIEAVLTKAVSCGKAKREKAARKAEAKKLSEANDKNGDAEVMEKLYKVNSVIRGAMIKISIRGVPLRINQDRSGSIRIDQDCLEYTGFKSPDRDQDLS